MANELKGWSLTLNGMLKRTRSCKYLFFISKWKNFLSFSRCHITKIAVVENTNTIWEYDPALPGTHILRGSLDVVAALRTLIVKVNSYPLLGHYLYDTYISLWQIQSSGQHIKYFKKLQLECKIDNPLKILLHSNTQWGTAYKMLDCSYYLCQVSSSLTSRYDIEILWIMCRQLISLLPQQIDYMVVLLCTLQWTYHQEYSMECLQLH